jgi:hypothetical protein
MISAITVVPTHREKRVPSVIGDLLPSRHAPRAEMASGAAVAALTSKK